MWYVGYNVTIQWTAAGSAPVSLLLFSLHTGTGQNATVVLDDVPNTGSYVYTVHASLLLPGYVHFVQVQPQGVLYSPEAPVGGPFTIESPPSGPCPPGTSSVTGQYPSCAPCAQGTLQVCPL